MFFSMTATISYEDKLFTEDVQLADPQFKLFTFDFQQGDPSSVFDEINSVVAAGILLSFLL